MPDGFFRVDRHDSLARYYSFDDPPECKRRGKKIFPNDWESVFGMCDEIVYLGGNEPNTHKWISDMLGQETVDTVSYGTSRGRSGGSSKKRAKYRPVAVGSSRSAAEKQVACTARLAMSF